MLSEWYHQIYWEYISESFQFISGSVDVKIWFVWCSFQVWFAFICVLFRVKTTITQRKACEKRKHKLNVKHISSNHKKQIKKKNKSKKQIKNKNKANEEKSFSETRPKIAQTQQVPQKIRRKQKIQGIHVFCVLFFVKSLFESLFFMCLLLFICFFFVFFGGVVLSCYICVFFNCYLFLDQCRKTVCPPGPFIKCLKVSQFSINWPGRCHWVTARRKKKQLYNLPRCFGTFLQTGQAAVTGSPPVEQKKTSTICHVVLPKSRILKNAKKKVYKVPPKMGTLYENVAGTL